MARKRDPKALVDSALSSFKGAVADLREATKLLDESARQKRALASRLTNEAGDLEAQADEASLIATRLSDLVTP